MNPADQHTVRSLLLTAARTLHEKSSTPRLDVELLLAHVLGCSRAHLLAVPGLVPSTAQITAFQHFVARRSNQEPVAYILGYRAFFGLDLLVDPRVLIPRPETELLVELALHAAQQHNARTHNRTAPLALADIGTGSGAIAIALATHLPQAHIYATDISTDALEVARQNSIRCGVSDRISLLHGDLLTPVPVPLDMIVSNPPYTILTAIDDDVRRYQPHLALDGGADGLHLYRRLLAQAPHWLRTDGSLLMEIDASQGQSVPHLLRRAFPAFHIAVHRDLTGWERVVIGEGTVVGSRPGDPG